LFEVAWIEAAGHWTHPINIMIPGILFSLTVFHTSKVKIGLCGTIESHAIAGDIATNTQRRAL